MISFETSVVIVSPLAEVFAYTTDIRNNINWQKSLQEAALTSGGSMAVGARYRYTVRFMGRRIETEVVVTAFEKDRVFSARALKGPISGEFNLHFERLPAGTVITTRCQADLGFFKFTKPLALRLAREQYRRDLDALKAILEK